MFDSNRAKTSQPLCFDHAVIPFGHTVLIMLWQVGLESSAEGALPCRTSTEGAQPKEFN